MIEETANLLTSFGGTAGALVIFAIWTNKKFSHVEKQISYIKGKLGIDE